MNGIQDSRCKNRDSRLKKNKPRVPEIEKQGTSDFMYRSPTFGKYRTVDSILVINCIAGVCSRMITESQSFVDTGGDDVLGGRCRGGAGGDGSGSDDKRMGSVGGGDHNGDGEEGDDKGGHLGGGDGGDNTGDEFLKLTQFIMMFDFTTVQLIVVVSKYGRI